MSNTINIQSVLSKKYILNSYTLIALSVLFIIVFDNHAFWSSLISVIDISDQGMPLFLFASFSFIFAVVFTFFTVFGIGRVLKPLIAFIFILSAITSYYMDSYGTVFDDVMVMNILQTNIHEAADLFESSILLHVFLFGVLPSIVLYGIRIKPLPFAKAFYTRLLSVFCVVAIAALSIYASYQNFSFVFRENREISFFVNPVYPIRAVYRFVSKKIRTSNSHFVFSFKDAHKIRAANTGEKNILIMAVGETARAHNFHLNGYHRETTPNLEKEDIINFEDVTSCGTATAISLPCMFSDLKHDNFDANDARNRQNLLDALDIAGIQVLWRENNPDCKGVCDRIETQQIMHLYANDDLCRGGQCFDEVLLKGLDDYIANVKNDAVIVLHMQGSHGPAYYKRFPDAFKKFVPECRGSAVQNCTDEEVVNAYDNTILYTDYALSKIIQHLKGLPTDINAAMVYVSDHGESLGENGLYLHGLPFYMAPDYQTHIPMIMWLSDSFASSKHLDMDCLRAKSGDPFTHDNLVHSVLGIMDVATSRYEIDLDLFSSCR